MTDITQALSRIESGDLSAADELMPVVYDELRKLAAAKLSQESPGQTLQATALVHEAYLRLVDNNKGQHWDSRRHFFAAAAEAMRRILVENARHKRTTKRGGGWGRSAEPPEEILIATQPNPLEIVAVHEALENLAEGSPRAAELVKLRYFLGCTLAEAAVILGIAHSTAEAEWTFARAWLRRKWLRSEKNP